MKPFVAAAFVIPTACLLAQQQEPASGFSVPVTVSGSAMYSERLPSADPGESPATAGFRAVFYPTLQLDEHWFGYAAIQIREAPYFYYDAFDPEHEFYTNVIQAFGGYSIRKGRNALVIKAGRLATAFGAFPIRYDEAENPLLDQPLSYITPLPLSASQIPQGVAALLPQYYGTGANSYAVVAYGGSGLIPVTLYSIPGVEADFSSGRFDMRTQLTSGSPSNPQSVTNFSKYRQWTAGGGFTIRQGFRVGASAFRGPYLGESAVPLLPLSTGVRSFPATGVGVDAQWARGRWSLNGEWQRFQFDLPDFSKSPSIQSGYAEAKSILTPRVYLAARAGWMTSGAITDTSGATASSFFPSLASYEFGGGYWIGRNELLKASYEWLKIAGNSGTKMNVLGAEFVFHFNSLGWSFR